MGAPGLREQADRLRLRQPRVLLRPLDRDSGGMRAAARTDGVQFLEDDQVVAISPEKQPPSLEVGAGDRLPGSPSRLRVRAALDAQQCSAHPLQATRARQYVQRTLAGECRQWL